MPTDDNRRGWGSNRRTFLAGAGAAGLGALGGCIGGDGDGNDDRRGSGGGGGHGGGSPDGELVLMTSTAESTAYASSQGMAAVMDEYSDNLVLDARPGEGTEANIGQLDRGEIDIAYTQHMTASDIVNGNDPFTDLSFTANQILHFWDIQWGFLSPVYEEMAEIESGDRVFPTPRGSGTAPLLEAAVECGAGHSDWERVNSDYSEQASDMSDGRLEVGVGLILDGESEPGYIEQAKSQLDINALSYSDEAVECMESHDEYQFILDELNPQERFGGYANDPGPISMPTVAYGFVVRNEENYDDVYEYLSTMWEYREEMADYHDKLETFQDEEYWVQNSFEDMPFHPAAADFYEEIGVWNDDWERGEE